MFIAMLIHVLMHENGSKSVLICDNINSDDDDINIHIKLNHESMVHIAMLINVVRCVNK